MNREPVLSSGTVTAIVTAAVALLVSYGFDITNDQQSAILGIVAVLAPLVAAVVARPKVTPLSSPRDARNRPLTASDGMVAEVPRDEPRTP
jgi:hypothetical protein